MESIISIGSAHATNDTILELLAKIFVELGTLYYDAIEPFMNQMSEFTFYLVKIILNLD